MFAQKRYDLIVNSEDERLQSSSAVLKVLGVSVLRVQSDRATYDGVEQLWRAVEENGRDLDAAAINAGVGFLRVVREVVKERSRPRKSAGVH